MRLSLSDHPEPICCHVGLIEKPVAPEDLARTATAFLVIRGMDCPGCTLRVHNSLLQLEGVLAVEVVLEGGLARVRYDAARVKPEAFPQVVATAGNGRQHYTARLLA